MAVLRGKERPAASFWVFAGLGAVAAMAFASLQSGGLGELHEADLLLFWRVLLCCHGLRGGRAARPRARRVADGVVGARARRAPDDRRDGRGRRPAAARRPRRSSGRRSRYLAVVSMFLGFFAWYRGLAIGPMAQVSQVQLIQPVLGILWSALFLHERIGLADPPRRARRHRLRGPCRPHPPHQKGTLMRHTPRYLMTDPEQVKELIRHHPWATFVSHTADGLVASHYPVLLDEEADDIVHAQPLRPARRRAARARPARDARDHPGTARLRLAELVRTRGPRPDLESRHGAPVRHAGDPHRGGELRHALAG